MTAGVGIEGEGETKTRKEIFHVTRILTTMENIIIISEWSTSNITTTHNTSSSKVLTNKKIRVT